MKAVNFKDKKIKIFDSPQELAERFAEEVVRIADESEKAGVPVCICLSGGSTPELLYNIIGDRFSKEIKWSNVHLFWGDERCVAPENPESNFRMTRNSLLEKIDIPPSNIHRIQGENDPVNEAFRYSLEITEFTKTRDGLPVFDLIILGLGEDGHTASIFPSAISLMDSDRICDVASHPVSKQIRITLTGRVINNAERVAFLVTGSKKAGIVEKIIRKISTEEHFPASGIAPVYGELSWYLDSEAASLL